MSVIQVVGSSRISNTIYLTVGSIYWTWILQLTGIPLDVTIETALVIIPVAALFGTMLWALQIEHNAVERIFYSYTKRSKRGKMFRIWMARTYLILMPWESSFDIHPGIEEMQKREIGRVIRSEVLHQEFEDLYQLFWVIAVAFPLAYLLSNTLLWLQGYVILVSISVIAIIAFPILHRKRAIVKQTLQFAFFRWFHEAITRDIENRNTDPRFLPYPKTSHTQRDGLQKASLRIVELAQRKDWEGFRLNVSHLEPILEKSLPSYFSEIEYNRVVRYWVWWVETSLEDILLYESTKDGLKMLEDALETLQQPKNMYLYLELVESERSFRNRVKSIIGGIKIQRSARLDRDFHLFEEGVKLLAQEPEEDWQPLRVFCIITKETVRSLEPKTVGKLSELPYHFLDTKIPSIPTFDTSTAVGLSNWVNFLLTAVEEGIGEKYSDRMTLSVEKIFLNLPSLAHHWGVKPKEYFSSCGPLTIHCFLEKDVGQTAAEIILWLHDIINKATEFDYTVSATLLLQKFDASNFRRLISEIEVIGDTRYDKIKKRVESLTEAILKEMNKDATDPNLHVLRGLYHEEKGRNEMAKMAYLEAATIDKQNIEHLIRFGKSLPRSYYYYNELACEVFKDALALCEEGDEFYSELQDCVSSACTKPSEQENDYWDD